MEHANLSWKGCMLGLCIFSSLLGFVPLGFGQEIEPNNTCPTAQDMRTTVLPLTLNGSLDSTPETLDVDFFRFTGTPGSVVIVDLEGQDTGQGTLGDPFLGLFDSNCNLLALDDDGSGTLNSRLVFTIPADGLFVLAATLCCDNEFLGGGIGTYRLSLTPFHVIGSISGRVIDALTGTPLPGDIFPFAFVELLRCEASGCFGVSSQAADSTGRFQFSSDFNGLPLAVGTYQVVASAREYVAGQTEPFDVGEGEDRDGDVPLQPAPMQFSEIRPCGDLPPEGGRCRYSVRIHNRQPEPFQGATWNWVESGDIGSFAGFTRFQPRHSRTITLAPEESHVVHFGFEVPSTVRNGAFICVQVFVGQGDSPFFDTVGHRDLFCLLKGFTGGFSVMSEDEVKALRQQVDERSVIPPTQQGLQKHASKKVR